jgi:hypothetical protein
MHKYTLILIGLVFTMLCVACKGDDTRTCLICSSPNTADFEVCDEGDGNASVNGDNTGTSFDVYISGLESAGANCGGN